MAGKHEGRESGSVFGMRKGRGARWRLREKANVDREEWMGGNETLRISVVYIHVERIIGPG